MMLVLFNNEVLNTICIVLLVAGLLFAGWKIYKGFQEYTYEEIPEVVLNEEGLKQVAEYRTYLVNQWICLLAFWFGIKTEEAQTKLTTPGINQNGVFFFHQNIEVYALFDWDTQKMEVKTNVFDEEKGYATHVKVFSLSDGSLQSDRLHKFILKAKEEHYGVYELSADDVIEITKQLRISGEAFPTEEAAKTYLFNNMADLIVMMRKKNLRNNKKLMQVYMGLIYYLWKQYGDDFLKFLKVEDEPQEKE